MLKDELIPVICRSRFFLLMLYDIKQITSGNKKKRWKISIVLDC